MGNPGNKRVFNMESYSKKKQHLDIRIIQPASYETITLLEIQNTLPVLTLPPLVIPVAEPAFHIELTDNSTNAVYATYDSVTQISKVNPPANHNNNNK